MKGKAAASFSPRFHGKAATRNVMLDVIVSLVPALVASVVVFGPRVLHVAAVTVASCVLSEFLCRRVMRKESTVGDLSAAVTGILLAFVLPSSIPLPIAALGSVVAIVVAKQMFGGIGRNYVNPALAGRIVLQILFPAEMNLRPRPYGYLPPADVAAAAQFRQSIPAGRMPGLLDMFFGNQEGCLGATCVFALLVGGVYLVARRVISPVIPVCFLGTAALLSFFMGRNAAQDLLSGGLVLGAVFMATDYATSPATAKGKAVYGAGCGAVTMLLRVFSGLAGDVSCAIVLMNLLAPLIDSAARPSAHGKKVLQKRTETCGGADSRRADLFDMRFAASNPDGRTAVTNESEAHDFSKVGMSGR